VTVHIFTNVEIFTGGRHRSCRLCVTRGDDYESSCIQTHRRSHGQNDQSHNLLQCSLSSIGGDNNPLVHQVTLTTNCKS